MKKIFTLLALCLTTLASFAQEAVTELTEGGKYYIAVGKGNNTNGNYVTANEGGEKLSMKKVANELVSKQTWTAHQVSADDNTWTFTLDDVDGEKWYMYTSTTNDGARVFAGNEETAADNFKNYIVTFNTDDAAATYADVQMLETADDPAIVYMNSFGGQEVGANVGPWKNGAADDGSKVYFTEASNVEIPTWNFDFNIYQQGDNNSRYFIQFNRDRTTNKSDDKGPKGIGGLTGNFLVLSVNNDTLVADSVIAGDADFANKIWHIKEYDALTHQIKLQNEAGKYIVYKPLATEIPGGNVMFTRNEETGEYVRTGNSGGGKLAEAWMATDNEEEAATVYVYKSNQGSECYAIGDQPVGNNFINVWGNVGWHHFMGKWEVNDPNCALKFVPITEYLQPEQIPADPTTGIATLTAAKKATNGTVYTVDGRVAGKSLNGLAKGLYIVNGKKVVK